jgi:hypothetical protein
MSNPIDSLSRFLYDINKYYLAAGVQKDLSRSKTMQELLKVYLKFCKEDKGYEEVYLYLLAETLSKSISNLGSLYSKKLNKSIEEKNQEEVDFFRNKIYEMKEFQDQIKKFLKKTKKE